MVIILRQCTFFIFKKDEDPLKIHSKLHDFVLFKQDFIKLRTSAKFRMTEKQLFQKPHGYNGIGLRTCNDWLSYHFTCFCLSVYCYPHWTPGNQCERDRNFHDLSRRLFSQSFYQWSMIYTVLNGQKSDVILYSLSARDITSEGWVVFAQFLPMYKFHNFHLYHFYFTWGVNHIKCMCSTIQAFSI